jgi:7-carboxy-7-deazaguanine synthase
MPDAEPQLRIAEIFTSVQGEGSWIGTPSIFVRISGCNLRCQWCDTPYASWHPEGTFRRVSDIVAELTDSPVRHVVITGGEPMLFEGTELLAQGLRIAGKTITIETAGTIMRNLACDLMSISPKLENSIPLDPTWTERHKSVMNDRTALAELIQAYPYQLKFVVESTKDLAEIENLLVGLPTVQSDRVFLMAEGAEAAKLHARERQLVDACIARGWRLAPRYHIDLFGNTKGT